MQVLLYQLLLILLIFIETPPIIAQYIQLAGKSAKVLKYIAQESTYLTPKIKDASRLDIFCSKPPL